MFIYVTRLTSNEIFSPSNKILREVGRAKDLSAPLYDIPKSTYLGCNDNSSRRFQHNFPRSRQILEFYYLLVLEKQALYPFR